MKNKRVKQMMCDLELYKCKKLEPKLHMWTDWSQGVWVFKSNGNVINLSKHTVSLTANELKG